MQSTITTGTGVLTRHLSLLTKKHETTYYHRSENYRSLDGALDILLSYHTKSTERNEPEHTSPPVKSALE
jgi:hypothetical protein